MAKHYHGSAWAQNGSARGRGGYVDAAGGFAEKDGMLKMLIVLPIIVFVGLIFLLCFVLRPMK